MTEMSTSSSHIDGYLPQSADDATIRKDVKTMLEQVEVHVENFYQNVSGSIPQKTDVDIALFDSPNLPNPLSSLLAQAKSATPTIKHALAYFTTCAITSSGQLDSSFLPREYLVLPRKVVAAKSDGSSKPGM